LHARAQDPALSERQDLVLGGTSIAGWPVAVVSDLEIEGQDGTPERPEKQRQSLRLATYNVQGRLWGGKAGTAQAIARVLEEIDADVFALQEVYPPVTLPRRWESPAGVGFNVIYGPTLTRGRGAYGNALLSRYPITEVQRIDLSLPRCEPRGALDARLDVDGVGLRVIGTHLGLGARERSAQLLQLLSLCAESGDDPLALMGDINEWRRRSRALSRLEACLGPSPRLHSFPSRMPIFALDRVWTRPGSALRKVVVHRTALSNRASDHLPVVATVDRPSGSPTRS
jgi:endonuclease/exonuclease/phosphatase family metal-dependent hydrolase